MSELFKFLSQLVAVHWVPCFFELHSLLPKLLKFCGGPTLVTVGFLEFTQVLVQLPDEGLPTQLVQHGWFRAIFDEWKTTSNDIIFSKCCALVKRLENSHPALAKHVYHTEVLKLPSAFRSLCEGLEQPGQPVKKRKLDKYNSLL